MGRRQKDGEGEGRWKRGRWEKNQRRDEEGDVNEMRMIGEGGSEGGTIRQ